MNAKLRNIQESCRNLVDEIGLVTKGKLPDKTTGDLEVLYEKLASFCQGAIQEIKTLTGERKLGEHQYYPELQAIAGGKFIPRLFS